MDHYYETLNCVGFREGDICMDDREDHIFDYFEEVKIKGQNYHIIKTKIEAFLTFPMRIGE